MKCELYAHQVDAVEFVMERISRALGSVLCYEMGLGKTFIGIGVASHFSEVYVFLPAYLKHSWMDAFEFAGVEMPVFISYDAREYPKIPAQALVILDESQYIKNRQSARWKRLLPSIRATRNRLLLTGTPLLNRHDELWTQMRLMGYAGSWLDFTKRYCGGRTRRMRRRGRTIQIWDTSSSTRSKELRELTMQLGFRYRNLDTVDLPPKRMRVVRVKRSAPPCGPPCDPLRDYQLRAQERIANPAWRRAVVSAVRARESAVVFARHVCVMDALQDMFPEARRIDGTRRDAIPESGVLLCSIGAASVGLTLTFASLCVFVECSWSAGVQAQCEARIHRIGQTRACDIVYILYGDEGIWASLQRKRLVTKRICHSK